MPDIKTSITDLIFIPEIIPAAIVEIIIAKSTLTFFTQRMQSKITEINAAFENKDHNTFTDISFVPGFLPVAAD